MSLWRQNKWFTFSSWASSILWSKRLRMTTWKEEEKREPCEKHNGLNRKGNWYPCHPLQAHTHTRTHKPRVNEKKGDWCRKQGAGETEWRNLWRETEGRQRRSEKRGKNDHYHLLFSAALVQTQRHILLILRQWTMQQQGLKIHRGHNMWRWVELAREQLKLADRLAAGSVKCVHEVRWGQKLSCWKMSHQIPPTLHRNCSQLKKYTVHTHNLSFRPKTVWRNARETRTLMCIYL